MPGGHKRQLSNLRGGPSGQPVPLAKVDGGMWLLGGVGWAQRPPVQEAGQGVEQGEARGRHGAGAGQPGRKLPLSFSRALFWNQRVGWGSGLGGRLSPVCLYSFTWQVPVY